METIETELEKNLLLAFTYFDKVPEDGSNKDNGDTQRILRLIETEELEEQNG